MTLRTALVIDGDSAGGQKALADLDRSIKQSEADAAGLAKEVQQGAAVMSGALDKTTASHKVLNLAANQNRLGMMEFQHIARGVTDQMASGAPVTQILAQHMGMLGEAVALSGGSFGKFGASCQGPWGLAMTAGVSILATMIPKLLQTSDGVEELVQKTKEQTHQAELQRRANAEWANSLDGVREAQRKLREEIEKSIRTEFTKDRSDLSRANAGLGIQQQAQTAAQQKFDQLGGQAKLDELERASKAAGPGFATPGGTAAARQDVDAQLGPLREAKKELDKLKVDIAASEATIRAAQVKLGSYEGQLASDFGEHTKAFIGQEREIIQELGLHNQTIADASATVLGSVDKYEKAVGRAISAGASTTGVETKLKSLVSQLKAGKIGPDEFTASIDRMTRSLNAAAKAAEEAKKAAKGTGEIGRQVSFDQAAGIARGAGLTVTSAYRSTEHQRELYNDPAYNHPGNPVARPGTSAHEGVNGKWALDIGFAPGLTAQSLKKLYGDQGVTLSAVYKESGHFHIEGSRSQAAAADRQADRADEQRVAQNDNYAVQSQKLDGELVAARGALLGSVDGQARFALEQLKADQDAYALSLQKAVDEHKLRDGQAKELLLKSQALEDQKEANLAVQTFIRKQDESQKTVDQDYRFRIEGLRYSESIAKTAGERRKIELEIIDLTYKQRDADLRIARAKAVAAQNWEEVARIDQALANLPAEKARDQGTAAQQNQTPFEQWAATVPQSAKEIGAALEEEAVKGINDFNDGLAEAIVKGKSLKDVFHNLAQQILEDLIKLALKEAELAVLKADFRRRLRRRRAAAARSKAARTYLIGEKGPGAVRAELERQRSFPTMRCGRRACAGRQRRWPAACRSTSATTSAARIRLRWRRSTPSSTRCSASCPADRLDDAGRALALRLEVSR
jgi:LAS superfamily LD-carboxypeptidase LdcB